VINLNLKLKGGIGNQLFQLNAALSLAKWFNANIRADLSAYAADSYKRLAILGDLFPEIEILPDRYSVGEVINEAPTCYDYRSIIDRISSSQSSTVTLDGYWQDRSFFNQQILGLISDRLRATSSQKLRGLIQQVSLRGNPVGVHFRRSDYRHHGTVRDSYYISVMQWLRGRDRNTAFYVFSDERNSVVDDLHKWGFKRFSLVSTGSDLKDLLLLSSLSTLVIANSTFSWWGAILSNASHVFFPHPWSKRNDYWSMFTRKNWIPVENSLETDPSVPLVTQDQVDMAWITTSESLFFEDGNPLFKSRSRMYCLGEATDQTSYDPHYVYHTAWAARRLYANPVEVHHDLGSDIRFVTIVSAFQRLIFGDIRPASFRLSGLESVKVDITRLPFADGSIKSLSCMHVVEHIGLGRYGDQLDYYGHLGAMKELQRVLAVGGLLYLVVPVGGSKIVFQAHRVFEPEQIKEAFNELNLMEFSLLTDSTEFVENAPFGLASQQSYGCGCFIFQRLSIEH
jgi:hypothetical protein